MTQRESNIAIFGRKTFFILPDSDLISMNEMEKLCEMGFETYIIEHDSLPLKDKIETIIRTFPDSILYFNIDARVSGISWESYIREVKMRHSGDALIGVVYRTNETKSNSDIANYYVRDLGVQAGCIALEPHNYGNIDVIKKTLESAWAKGRRSNIRVECDENSSLEMSFQSKNYTAHIEDINLTHFRCSFAADNGMKIFDKVRDAHVNFNGFPIVSDAVLIMKRTKEGIHSYIFMFIHNRPVDLPDLEEKTMNQLNSKIYKLLASRMASILRRECHV